MAGKVLVLLAHPVLERSRVNRRLAEAAAGLEGVTVHDLYETYPTLSIDARREQALLLRHQAVVLQHPFYWYSSPALLKEWQDIVLEHGWAYGKGGNNLAGKVLVSAITTGGPAMAYRKDGYNRFTLKELLAPFDQTAHLCGMKYLAPFALHGSLRFETPEEVVPHTTRYVRLLSALRDGELDLDRATAVDNLADGLDGLISARAGAPAP
jgi:glutathione-regulated potassium-efflux system ancillary protein KefG